MSSRDTRITCHHFGKKPVFVFSDHATALKAWARLRTALGERLLLLTLDYHTDTREAFLSYGCGMDRGNFGDGWIKYAQECLAKIDISDPATMDDALKRLKHDEHVRAAINLNVIEAAFVVAFAQYPDGGTVSEEAKRTVSRDPVVAMLDLLRGTPRNSSSVLPRPHTYSLPASRVFYIPNQCFVGCEARPHTEECRRLHANQAIESAFLDDKLAYCDEMTVALGYNSLFERPYILDIDLDYFQTKAALSPGNPNTLYKLLQGAIGITIALEPRHVRYERIDGDLEYDFSLCRLMKHCELALGPLSHTFEF